MTNSAASPLPLLDARLTAIVDAVPSCRLAADIGADHGRLSCWLLASARCEAMIVSDISEVSRKKAWQLLTRYHVADRVHLSGEDGLFALREAVDAVIISGMGGRAIVRMLAQEVDLAGATLILGAHSKRMELRKAVIKREYAIKSERITLSDGRFYSVMTAVPGKQVLTEKEMMVGYNLFSSQPDTLRGYLVWQLSVAGKWRGAQGDQYREWLREEIQHIESKCTDDL